MMEMPIFHFDFMAIFEFTLMLYLCKIKKNIYIINIKGKCRFGHLADLHNKTAVAVTVKQ